MINTYIAALAAYGLKTGLITADDRIFAINSILAALGPKKTKNKTNKKTKK